KRAGIKSYRSFVADLTRASFSVSRRGYDLVIADVPCSGSGTWARTPEQLYFFQPDRIDHYQALQQKIVCIIAPALKTVGVLLYTTCSVFKKENEEMVWFIQDNTSLLIDKMELLKEYTHKADSKFAARFIKRA